MSRKYLSCAETAKLLRAALKESFPGVKFSVKSSVYSGGASIRVGWQDGPSGAQVKEATSQFQGSYFDGMIDYKGSRYHLLDGAPVSFGADFIFLERKQSFALANKIAYQLSMKGWQVEVKGSDESGCWIDGKNSLSYHIPPYQIEEAEAAMGSQIEAKASPTLARVSFQGDDGYGQGTVGMPGSSGGEQCYKAIAANQARIAAEQAVLQ